MINNEPIAEGLALDVDGNPTTDAKKAFEGVCLPFGGPKGSALAMLMDMLCGMYTGSNYAGDVSSLYYRFDEPQNLGHFMLHHIEYRQIKERKLMERISPFLLF